MSLAVLFVVGFVVIITAHAKSLTRHSRCGAASGSQLTIPLALGFLDLIEIRFVDAFRRVGVSWATLRRANERAQEMFGGSHPFCTNRFVTDG